ncbi:MAG: hypothetical protein ACYTF6_01705 [Planctomycetota bacterium]|jgi:hypothetical protein
MKKFTILTVTATLVYGCPSPKAPPSLQELKALTSQAASISNQVLLRLQEQGGSPGLTGIRNQTLAAVILFAPLKEARSEAAVRELHSLSSEPRLIHADNSRPHESFHIFLPENVTAITADVKGDEIAGKVSFRVPEWLEGTVEYTARRFDGGWRVVEFHMPANGIRTVLAPGGTWKAEIK